MRRRRRGRVGRRWQPSPAESSRLSRLVVVVAVVVTSSTRSMPLPQAGGKGRTTFEGLACNNFYYIQGFLKDLFSFIVHVTIF